MEDLVNIKTPQSSADMLPRKGVYIRTFGCQMNEYDSEKLYKILEPEYGRVADPADADLVLVNTCSVRDRPEKKLYSVLGELKDLKRTNKQLIIGVGGCVAQQEGEQILKRSSVVDLVFGTHNLSLVPNLIRQRLAQGRPQVAVDYRDEWEDLPFGFVGEERVSVFVAISRGCNKNCTFCIVPTTRGPETSRALSEIEREIKIAAHRGAKEVVLLGQTVNSWGRDFKDKDTFANLLSVVSAIEGISRIRFMSPHPQEIREDFVELVRDNPKICKHIHMPLQSGSDDILKAMNRNYRRTRYLSIIEQLQAAVPEIAITTDIIVGFPGESEKDFQDTLEIMREVQFDASYSYIYSQRPGTPAALMPDSVSAERKLERLKELQRFQDEITTTRLGNWVGKRAEILVGAPSKHSPELMQGRTSQNIVLNLEVSDTAIVPGLIMPVMVTEVSRYTLKGRPLVEQLAA